MTERGRAAGARDASTYQIGPSGLRWEDDGLTIDIAERAVPHLAPMRGRVRVRPEGLNARAFTLDDARRHHWRPIGPVSRVEVAMERPALSWAGHGYLDMNWGAEPLEQGFRRWDWSRAALRDGGAILYDAEPRRGAATSLGLRLARDGTLSEITPPPRAKLPTTLWRVKRTIQADEADAPRELRRLEDAPFYARAELSTRLYGEAAHAVHETFDGDRFATRWVKCLLPFRMPRIA